MSKSQKNFYTLRDVLDGGFTGRPVAPAVLRFELLKANYRTQLNFTRQGLLDSAGAVQKLRDAAARWAAASGQAALPDVGLDHPVLGRIAQRLGDDLNTAGALGELFEYIGSEPSDAGEALSVLREVDSVLGVLDDAEAKQAGDNARDQAWADAAAGRLDDARAGKDFDAADALRAELVEAGYEVQTTGGGTVARRKLA
jgi:cysteinyl-tRNA synthetase